MNKHLNSLLLVMSIVVMLAMMIVIVCLPIYFELLPALILNLWLNSPQMRAIKRDKWPASIETSAEWHDGKYQIVLDFLIEFEEGHNKKSHGLQSELEKWYRDGDLVFLLGGESLGVLDVQNISYVKYQRTNIVESYQSNFDILTNGIDPRIINIEPVPRGLTKEENRWPDDSAFLSAKWHEGKYQISRNALIEYEGITYDYLNTLQTGIEKWYQEGDLVVLLGEGTFGVLDLHNLSYMKCQQTNVVELYHPNLSILTNGIDSRIR